MNRLKSTTLHELTNKYNRNMDRRIKSSTKASNKYMSNLLFQWMEEDISDLDHELIEEEILNPIYETKSVAYTNKVRSYLNKIFNFAVAEELISFNPVSKINIYKDPDMIKEEVKFYTPDSWRIINQATESWVSSYPKDYPYFVIFCFLYFMGMRIGEVLALSKQDIIDDVNININKTCYFCTKKESSIGYIITSPKTQNSRRTILMPQVLQQILNQYLLYYEERYTNDAPFLFGGNKPIHIKNVGRKFKRIIEKSKLPTLKIHSLRHSHASFLINNGAMSKAVAERLGNTESEVQKTYSHLFKASSDACVELIDAEFLIKANSDAEVYQTSIALLKVLGYNKQEREQCLLNCMKQKISYIEILKRTTKELFEQN